MYTIIIMGSKIAFTLGCHGEVFWATVCKTVRPIISCPFYLTLVYCGQTVGWIKNILGM